MTGTPISCFFERVKHFQIITQAFPLHGEPMEGRDKNEDVLSLMELFLFVQRVSILCQVSVSGGTENTTKQIRKEFMDLCQIASLLDNLDVNIQSALVGRTRELWMKCSDSQVLITLLIEKDYLSIFSLKISLQIKALQEHLAIH